MKKRKRRRKQLGNSESFTGAYLLVGGILLIGVVGTVMAIKG